MYIYNILLYSYIFLHILTYYYDDYFNCYILKMSVQILFELTVCVIQTACVGCLGVG